MTRGTRPKKPSSSRGFAKPAELGDLGDLGDWKPKTNFFFLERPRGCGRSPSIKTTNYVHTGQERGGEGRGGAAFARTLGCVRTDALMSARTQGRVCMDAPIYPRGNLITGATVRPSHGRPSGHRPIVRPAVRPSILNRPRDNPACYSIESSQRLKASFFSSSGNLNGRCEEYEVLNS
jgi:hypothetical protein